MAKKIIAKKEHVPAVRKFTDREQPRKVFFDRYEALKQQLPEVEDIYVVTYYGVGGIGKTTLLKKLQEELKEKVKKPYFLSYDFENSQDPKSVLRMMKTKLEQTYQFSFPLFDLALYSYSNKIGESVEKKEVQSLIEQSRTLSFIMDSVSDFPVLGMAAKLLKLADSGIAVLRNITGKYKKELKQIEEDSAENIYHDLPYYFSMDLKENIAGCKEPLVIFLDTYEKLVNEMEGVGFVKTKDLWLRDENGPILNVPGILWVIAGREKIKWGEFDPDWEDTLDQHILGDLSFPDANQFLQEAGIIDASLRQQIYDLTHGTPLYLDICISTYENFEPKEKMTIADFGKNIDHLVERYIRYMDHQTQEMAYMLSCIPLWNDGMVQEIGPKILPDFSYVLYDKIKDLSFINQTDGYYYIHSTVRNVFLTIVPEALRKRSSEVLYLYYRDFLLAHSTLDENYMTYLHGYLEVICSNIETENYRFIFEDVLKVSDALSRACLFQENYHFAKTLYERLQNPYEDLEHGYLLTLIYAISLPLVGQKEEAISLLEQVFFRMRDQKFSPTMETVIENLYYLYQQSYTNDKIALEIMEKLKEGSHDDPETADYWLVFYSYLLHDEQGMLFYLERFLENDDIPVETQISLLGIVFLTVPIEVIEQSSKILVYCVHLEPAIHEWQIETDGPERLNLDFIMASALRYQKETLEKALYYIDDAEQMLREHEELSLDNVFSSIVLLKLEILEKKDSKTAKQYATSIFQSLQMEEESNKERDLLQLYLLPRIDSISYEERMKRYEEIYNRYQEHLENALQTLRIIIVNNDYRMAEKLAVSLLERILQDPMKHMAIYEEFVLDIVPYIYPAKELETVVSDFYQQYQSYVQNAPQLLLPVVRRMIQIFQFNDVKKEELDRLLLDLGKQVKDASVYANIAYEIADDYKKKNPKWAFSLIEEALHYYEKQDASSLEAGRCRLVKGKILLELEDGDGLSLLMSIFHQEHQESNILSMQAAKAMYYYLPTDVERLKDVTDLYQVDQELYGESSHECYEDLYLRARHLYLSKHFQEARETFVQLLKNTVHQNTFYLEYLDQTIDFLYQYQDYEFQILLSERMLRLLHTYQVLPISLFIKHVKQYAIALVKTKEGESVTPLVDTLRSLIEDYPSLTKVIEESIAEIEQA